jgi:hypothetical protein
MTALYGARHVAPVKAATCRRSPYAPVHATGIRYNCATSHDCHSERSEESNRETLRCTQGDKARVPIP